MRAAARPVPHGPAPATRRIVVGVDGSDGSTQALEWAAGEAGRTGATLELHTAYGPGGVLTTPASTERAMRRLVEQSTAHVHESAPNVDTVGLTHEGSPVTALIDASRGAELLVVGSRGRGGFAGLLLGSVSQQCAVHAHCPVVIVRPTDDAASGAADG
ncbi:MAG: universal stress protein [Acidimicrobiales bacterium]